MPDSTSWASSVASATGHAKVSRPPLLQLRAVAWQSGSVRGRCRITFEGSLPDAIRDAMTNLHNAGFDLDTAAVVMNVETELLLKQTPIDPAVPQMIIENGLCCGYPYIVNKYFGTMKDLDGQLESPYPFCLGVGVFNWCAVSQHAGGRIILDGSTAKTAGRNITSMVVNTWWSMTNMASHMTTSLTGRYLPSRW